MNDTDKFSFNNDFSCPLAKIKIQTVVNKVESAEESKETEEKVDEARNTVCDVSAASTSNFFSTARMTDPNQPNRHVSFES